MHSNELTREQLRQLADGVRGGVDALRLELPPEIEVAPEHPSTREVTSGATHRHPGQSDSEQPRRHLSLKRLAIVTATAVAAINTWTGAPLLAVWVGSQVQSGRLLSMWGVGTVLLVLGLLAYLLTLALSWLTAKYDELTGRPAIAAHTSPWHRMLRGDRVEDIRSRYGVSAPEKVVAACVVAGVLTFEIWFFFFAGSPI